MLGPNLYNLYMSFVSTYKIHFIPELLSEPSRVVYLNNGMTQVCSFVPMDKPVWFGLRKILVKPRYAIGVGTLFLVRESVWFGLSCTLAHLEYEWGY